MEEKKFMYLIFLLLFSSNEMNLEEYEHHVAKFSGSRQ